MIRNLITLHLVVWHFDIFCSRLPQWQPSLKGSDTCNILCLYIFNVQNISTHYKSAFLLFYVFAYWLLYNNIILLLFCATLYICISCFNHWQVIKVKQEPFSPSVYNIYCQICFRICTICVIQCVFHAWLSFGISVFVASHRYF